MLIINYLKFASQSLAVIIYYSAPKGKNINISTIYYVTFINYWFHLFPFCELFIQSKCCFSLGSHPFFWEVIQSMRLQIKQITIWQKSESPCASLIKTWFVTFTVSSKFNRRAGFQVSDPLFKTLYSYCDIFYQLHISAV